MRKWLVVFIVAVFVWFFIFLFSDRWWGKSGEFAFLPVKNLDMGPLERSLFRPRVFKKYREPIFFDSNRVLWFTYRPFYPQMKIPYAISLAKKSLGWVEVDLKNQKIHPEEGVLIDFYEGLETGDYQIRIAEKNKVIDSIEFKIKLSPEQDLIDYETLPSDKENFEDNIHFYSQ